MKHELISFPAGDTYDLVESTLVHAHPANHRSYPRHIPEYITIRKKGGIMEHIYRVESVVDVDPNDIESVKDRLRADDYSALSLYVSGRMPTYGFETPGPYRFYILRRYKELTPPRVKKPNPRGFYYSTIAEIEEL